MEATTEKVCTLCGAEGHTAGNCKWLRSSVDEICDEEGKPGEGGSREGLAQRLRAALVRLEPRALYIIMVEELRLAVAIARRAGFVLRLVALDDKWAQLSLNEVESRQIGAMVKFIT